MDFDQRACIQFGKTVRALRMRRRLSQESLANKANIDRSYMGGIERGERNPSLSVIWRLARALRVTPTELLDRC
ncbi:MAG TPA: helix-turn-helix transcriptional regulator [Elusimicrobiota bacterium]|nr:helix-turn-helix transcriptional regulator [Elusimicrobiota bacterium]